MRRLILALFLVASPALASPTTTMQLDQGGTPRDYLLHIPDTLPPGPVPLVISIHALNSTPANAEHFSGFSPLADEQGFIVAYPAATQGRWNFATPGDDTAFILAVIEDVARQHPIDRTRIYADGMSNGAQMTWALACYDGATFAAFGMVSGSYLHNCDGPRDPLILFHGTADRVLPYGGKSGTLPVPDFARDWASRPGCTLPHGGTPLMQNGDVTGVSFACDPAAPVEFYTIAGAGHTWPGSVMQNATQDIDATRAMWAFFQRFHKS